MSFSASIRTKLSAAFATALVLVVAVGAFGLLQLNSVNNVTREIREGWLPKIELLGQIKRSIAELQIMAARRMQTRNFRDLAAVAKSRDAALNELRGAEQSLQRLASSDDEKALLSQFLGKWDVYQDGLRVVFDRLERGEISAASHDFNTTSLASFNAAADGLERLIAFSKQRSEAAAARAQEVYELALYLTIIVILMAAICAGAAIVWTSRKVISPMLRVSQEMRRLTAEDSSVASASNRERTDEIGDLFVAAAGYRDALLNSRRLAREAEQERERLQAAVSNMPIGLCMFDSEQQLIISNSRYAELYNIPQDLTKPGTPLRNILQARITGGIYAEIKTQEHINVVLERAARGKPDLDTRELHDGRILNIIHQPMEGGGWVATHEDVTERRRAEDRIRHMARHDALTDLPNRVLFKERIEEVLRHVPRGETAAVLCLDLDRFKSVNDTLGHPVGDALLKSVADRLRESVREADSVARFGGDEFAIIQLGGPQPQAATALSQRIIEKLSAPYSIDGHQIVIGTSIGVALVPDDGCDADTLLKNADMALYRAKNDGRGIYRFFESEMDARMQARRTLELDLRRALIEGEFELFYQPVVNVKSRTVTSFEALVRWQHPQRGLVSPADFIPLAEEIGLIVPLGEWILRRACCDAASWPDGIAVAVNLSPVQFKTNKLLEAVMTALAVSKLPAHRLELEITEGVLLVETDSTLSLLHQLRALGVRIAMDDFGTGYSSLSYLRSFPFDKIKIDRSFIRSMSEQDSSIAIIRAVTGLSASLGMATTAEGVETREQLDRVVSEGCTEVQGFLFSAARPVSEVDAVLASIHRGIAAAA
jgi:diguanylate cyclase (GGDEF)-like protein